MIQPTQPLQLARPPFFYPSWRGEAAPPNGQTALILISGSVNYYYDNIGRRVGEALRTLGFEVHVRTLREAPIQAYDWVFVNPVAEVAHPYGNIDEALRRIAAIVRHARHSANILLECVQTHWFVKSWEPFRQVHIETLLDLGLHDQRAFIPPSPPGMADDYRFMVNGLTQRERQIAQYWIDHPGGRPIPWTFVGHAEPIRVQFLDQVMHQLDRQGFVYMPQLTHITEDGPHMNGQHMQATLERTQYFLWRTHHDFFYMESERFRSALLAGAVPVKIMNTALIGNRSVPFRNLLLDERTFGEAIHALDFEKTRQAFIREFLALPSMEEALAAFIAERTGALPPLPPLSPLPSQPSQPLPPRSSAHASP